MAKEPDLAAVTVAEAKNHLPALLHSVESGKTLHITRRGKPVAVVLSKKDHDALLAGNASKKPGMYDAVMGYRNSVDWANSGIDGTELDNLRDRTSTGRVSPFEGAGWK
jgi:antitoxin Phd